MRNKTKKHLPKKNCQANRMRALLLNIDEGIKISSLDFAIDETEFNAYFKALEQTGYIALQKGKKEFDSTSYVIQDIEKFDKLKRNAYRIISKHILPCVSAILAMLV